LPPLLDTILLQEEMKGGGSKERPEREGGKAARPMPPILYWDVRLLPFPRPSPRSTEKIFVKGGDTGLIDRFFNALVSIGRYLSTRKIRSRERKGHGKVCRGGKLRVGRNLLFACKFLLN